MWLADILTLTCFTGFDSYYALFSNYLSLLSFSVENCGTLAYKKFKLEQWFSNISYLHTPECCIQRKKKSMWWSSDQQYKQTGGKGQTETMHTPNRFGFKICEKLTHFPGTKDICGTMWPFLKSTHLVHLCIPHQAGTPWGVLYDTPGWQALV